MIKFDKEDLIFDIEENNKDLRESDSETWVAIRKLIKEKGLKPHGVSLALFFEDYKNGDQHGAIITNQKKIYYFIREDWNTIEFLKWDDKTEDIEFAQKHPEIPVALKILF